MTEYTPKQIIDILLQSPDRIKAETTPETPQPTKKSGIRGLLPNEFKAKSARSLDEITLQASEPHSLNHAAAELRALGFSRNAAQMHINAVQNFGPEAFENAMGMLAIKTRSAIFINNLDWGPQYHMGLKINDTKSDQTAALAELYKTALESKLTNALEYAKTNLPFLMNTRAPEIMPEDNTPANS